jgi:hypothetical protein
VRVLISTEPTLGAHHYERVGLARACSSAGFETKLWNLGAESPFDVFDNGFIPDLFITQLYNLTPSTLQCIAENPNITVWAKGGDWGSLADTYDLTKYQILVADDKQKENAKALVKASNKQVYIGAHYLESRKEDSHGYYRTIGCEPLHSRLAADFFEYSGAKVLEEFKSDIAFCGSYWPYKAINFNKYLFQFLRPDVNYNVKIFGNGVWPCSQYCGQISNENVKNLFKSAKININVSEIHAQAYGAEHCERIYKVLLSGGFLISDYNSDIAENVFNNEEMVWCKDEKQMKNFVDHYLKYEHEKNLFVKRGVEKVLKNETYHHRMAYLLASTGFMKESEMVLDAFSRLL